MVSGIRSTFTAECNLQVFYLNPAKICNFITVKDIKILMSSCFL